MIAILAAAFAPFAEPTLGTLPAQALPSTGCAAYLWSPSDRRFVGMAEPGRLRIVLDGKPVDLAAASATGMAGLGLAATTVYRTGSTTATLDLTVQPRADLTGGALVSAATLRLEREGQDGLVAPLAGLVGCAADRAGS
ncbi:hypothetical protein [Sphingomonas carotinifaciens]|uniref:Uncharacterized protein n=1 Tax=Sphingomonas carotinifaciens TaxID=1166323 RepID=A0A1G7K973_9SPHN|nr:hypothetical protein [Sphingomonas carotinifaciens]MBB4085181.1 hypothetical protein [Sphingomonas carotinifaciens]MWC43791.1 hypothetical protein [Sphingomonas carotinifaciens]SDF33706.1 hypothetical protein SAMN05216557_10324 [Sphingomonas carotinifaciens]